MTSGKLIRNILKGGFVSLVLLILAGQSHATMILGDAMPLADLVAGGTITAGDKLFSDFNYVATEDAPASNAVNVIPIQDNGGNYGVRFQGGFFDQPGGSASDALITYVVEVTNPSNWIDGAFIAANPAVPGGGTIAVTETYIPDFVGAAEILNLTTGGDLVDSVTFMPPAKRLNVQKDILLNAGTQAASLSFVDQTFHQIPEPASVTMLSLSALALIGWRRR